MTEEQSTHRWVSRRRWLAVSGGTFAGALAGCLDGDNSDNGPADDSTDNPDDDDDTTSGNDDNTTSGDDGNDEGNGDDGTDNSNGSGIGPPAVTVSAVSVGETPHGDPAEVMVTADRPVTVTLSSDSNSDHNLLVEMAVYAVEDPDAWPAPGDDAAIEGITSGCTPVATAADRLTVPAGDEATVTLTRLTDELAGGPYVVVAAVDVANTRAATPMAVRATAEVPVEVYTRQVGPDHRPDNGRLVLTANDTAMDPLEEEVADLEATASPTVEIPLGLPTDSVTLTAREVNDSVVPPGSVQVPLGPNPNPVEIVAGYEFQGTDAMRFSHYIKYLREERVVPPYEQWVRYGTYAANGDYNSLYTWGGSYADELWHDSTDGDPPAYGADLQALSNEIGLGTVDQSVEIGDEALFYNGLDNQWEPIEESTDRGRSTHVMVLEGLDAVTEPTPEERQFVCREEYRGRTVDVFNISTSIDSHTYPDSNVYVDSETGHILRVERQLTTDEFENFLEITEFFSHGDPETADIGLITERSTNNTSNGLEELPWE